MLLDSKQLRCGDTPRPHQRVPRHIAIIMDGNGRWARQRMLPRYAGHQAGLKTVRTIVEQCAQREVEVLTLFAFSSENWFRPRQEVIQIMDLFFHALRGELRRLQKNQVRLRIIGERTAFAPAIVRRIHEAEQLTAANNRLLLQIAANYGGRWDIVQATRQLAQQVQAGTLRPEDINETNFAATLTFPDCPDPDLLIRTGGEQRVSNFLLWQIAYAELYFSEQLWPDFNEKELEKAMEAFANRQRRFGKTGEQVEAAYQDGGVGYPHISNAVVANGEGGVDVPHTQDKGSCCSLQTFNGSVSHLQGLDI